MATIREIAEKIGVSPTTVSNVINGHTEKVSPETLEKVERALEAFQYGRQISRAPVTTQIPFIAVGFGMDHSRNMMMDPFCGELFGAIEQEAHQYERHILYFTPETEEEILRVSAPWNVEGVIMLGWKPELCGHLMRRCSKPVVFVDSFFGDGDSEYENVGLQDYNVVRCDYKRTVCNTFKLTAVGICNAAQKVYKTSCYISVCRFKV